MIKVKFVLRFCFLLLFSETAFKFLIIQPKNIGVLNCNLMQIYHYSKIKTCDSIKLFKSLKLFFEEQLNLIVL